MFAALSQRERRPAFRILRNAGSILISDAGGEVLTTYAIGLAAVSLGPSGFGTLSEAQAFMDPFEAFALFGLAQVSITVAARRAGCDGALRGTILGLRLAFSLIAAASALVCALFLGRQNLLPILALLSFSLLFTPFSTTAVLPFQYERTMHRLLALPFLVSLVRLATAFFAQHTWNTPVAYQLSGCAAGIAGALLNWRTERRYYPAKLTFDMQLARSIVRLGWPVALVEFLVMLYSRASYFLLHQVGAEAQGEYAAADKLVRPVLGIALALCMSSLPTIAEAAARDDMVSLRKMFRLTVKRVSMIAGPLLLAACWVVPPMLQRYVPAYAASSEPFRILAVGSFFMFLNRFSTIFVVAMGRFRLVMVSGIINLVVYLAVAQWLIPSYQAVGAALATTAMEAINTCVLLIIVFYLLRTGNGGVRENSAAPS